MRPIGVSCHRRLFWLDHRSSSLDRPLQKGGDDLALEGDKDNDSRQEDQ
jgi:hypothetical protein